ncbi:MAG: GxxExxY protein [Rubrivivax sp.]|nr:GxxExxY protein [Rubrivivax sp.]
MTDVVIGAAIEVHRVLGPGLLEGIYERALRVELASRAIACRAQVPVPVVYKGQSLGSDLRLDLVVDARVIVEVKAVAALEEVHAAQLLSYLRLTGLRAGLLINFNVPVLRHGIRRVANTRHASAPSASSAPLR